MVVEGGTFPKKRQQFAAEFPIKQNKQNKWDNCIKPKSTVSLYSVTVGNRVIFQVIAWSMKNAKVPEFQTEVSKPDVT